LAPDSLPGHAAELREIVRDQLMRLEEESHHILDLSLAETGEGMFDLPQGF
jgi:hypothetical protein